MIVTPGTHIDGVREYHSEYDEQLAKAQEYQDIVKFEVKTKAIVIVTHIDIDILKEGIRLQQKYDYLDNKTAEFTRSNDGLLLV